MLIYFSTWYVLHCAQESEKRCLDKWQSIYIFWDFKKKKEFTDRIVPRGQLSDKENGKIEALTGDKRSEKFVFITPGYCLPYSRWNCNSWVIRVLHLTVPGPDFSWHIMILQISAWTEGRVIRGLFLLFNIRMGRFTGLHNSIKWNGQNQLE